MQTNEFRHRNILDSTAPEPRGKERMIPRKKKPKTMKRLINYEKATRANEGSKESVEPLTDPSHLDVKSTDEEQSSFSHYESESLVDVYSLSERFSLMELGTELDTLIKIILHPPYYREYVDQALTNQVEYTTYTVLINLIRFQDRVHHNKPEKLQIKRRYVCGFNQVNKSVRHNKAKAVIIAPDVQKIIENGILDRTVDNLINSCTEKEIPVIFTSKRNSLAKVCCKNPRTFLSCIAILDYSGTQDDFHRLIDLVNDAKEIYRINRIDLKNHLQSLSEPSLQGIYRFIEDEKRIPKSLQIYRDTIYMPLRRDLYSYLKLIKNRK